MTTTSLDRSLLHEQGFNYKLAEALAYINANWRENPAFIKAERPGAIASSKQRADIIVDDPKIPRVVIECAYGGDGDKDADYKLRTGDFHTAISLSIPDAFRYMSEEEAKQELLRGAEFEYAVKRTNFRFPSKGYIKGTTKDLATMILSVAVPKNDIESVATEVAEFVDRAAEELKRGLSETDCRAIAKSVYQKTNLSAFRTVMILWLDAMLVQRQLRKKGVEVGILPMSDVNVDELIYAWKGVLALNWRSIFSPAIEVLERSAERALEETKSALDWLIKAVNKIQNERLGDYINVGAELFPKVSEDRKPAAAFYTTPSTAEMLALLTIRESDRADWSNPNIFKKDLRIVDMACGTGTLIRAAFNRVRSFHDASGGTVQSYDLMHRLAMEEGLRGCDVSPIASHLTNSSLAIQGNGGTYGTTHIGWVSVGTTIPGSTPSKNLKSKLTTGSLELFERDSLYDLFDSISRTTEGVSAASALAAAITVHNSSVDYVIMNPPYSRTRGGQSVFDIAGLSAEQRRRCQNRWSQLIRNEPCTKVAGLGASFVCLAARKVKPGGRIGFVLPNTAAFADAWGVTRKMIIEKFTEITVVSKAGKSEGIDALSADTHIGELLLVAQRKTDLCDTQESRVKCVTLRYWPIDMGVSGEFAKSILATSDAMTDKFAHIRIGEEQVGTIEEFEANGEDPWSALGALNPELSLVANRLAKSGVLVDVAEHRKPMEFSVHMRRIEDVFDVGPTHDLIGHLTGNDPRGAYTFSSVTDDSDAIGGIRALWSTDSRVQRTLSVSPTHKGVVYDKSKSKGKSIRRGKLHYQRGIQWTSQRILAASTTLPVFGGTAWTTLIHHDERVEKAFALWANSSLGMLVQWTRGQRSQRGRSRVQVNAIKQIPCPDLAALNDSVLRRVCEQFKQLSQLELKPAMDAVVDKARHQIDEAVIEMLGLEKNRAKKILAVCRAWWSSEPTITGRDVSRDMD